jgi:nucleoside diphosphate kinase
MDGVDEFALLVLKPDAVHQGLAPGIRDFLRARGLRVVTSELREITPEVRYRLYEPDSRPWATHWALGGVLYTLGPALVMLLHADRVPAGHTSASHYLSRGLKGHYDPLRAAAGTIRGEFNAINPALNLVHAADDSPDLVRERSVLLDAPAVDAAASGEAAGPLDLGAAIVRVHEWLLDRDGCDSRLREATTRLLAGCRQRLAAETDRSARRAILRSTLDSVRHLAERRGDEVGRLSLRLSDRAGLPMLDYDAVFDDLARAGLTLDPWSRYLLHTSLYYLDASLP